MGSVIVDEAPYWLFVFEPFDLFTLGFYFEDLVVILKSYLLVKF